MARDYALLAQQEQRTAEPGPLSAESPKIAMQSSLAT